MSSRLYRVSALAIAIFVTAPLASVSAQTSPVFGGDPSALSFLGDPRTVGLTLRVGLQ